MGILMGIDYGVKRIGIAISNPERTMSVPLTVIEVKPDSSHLKAVEKIANDYKVEEIIIGMPYNMDGTEGDSSKKAMAFSELIKTRLEIPVKYYDERLTTFEAHNLLASINMDNRKRLKVVDSLAAKIILQGYMDLNRS
jgi:putative Holliday junction resolvase